MNDNDKVDQAATAHMFDASDAERQREQRRRLTWGPVGPESMTRLAATFPSLSAAPGVSPWDTDAFLKYAASGVLSHGEILAAKFVLGVWNSGADWEKEARRLGLLKKEQKFSRFDLFEAMNVWDQEHINAALAWIELPFFP